MIGRQLGKFRVEEEIGSGGMGVVPDQIASVIAREPDWKALPCDLDPRVLRLLRRCLEKDSHKRLCDAGDARLELDDVLSGVPSQAASPPRSKLWPGVLWEGHYSQGLSSSCGAPGVSSGNYDVTADGQRFLMIKDHHQDVSSNRLVVVLNWIRELDHRR